MSAACPPNSKEQRTSRYAAMAASCLPTENRPDQARFANDFRVQQALRTRWRISEDQADHTRRDAYIVKRARSSSTAQPGVRSDGLMMNVQPAANASLIFRGGKTAGKFQAQKAATDPIGSRRTSCRSDAYFSDRGRSFQSDRGRRFSLITDGRGGARKRGVQCSSIVRDQPETLIREAIGAGARCRLIHGGGRRTATYRPTRWISRVQRAGGGCARGHCSSCGSRSDLPLSAILWLLWTMRSRIASASVGSSR